MSQYKHIKGLQPQSPRSLKINHSDYYKLLKGEEVNLSASEVKQLEDLGVQLEKADSTSFSKPVTNFKKGVK